MGLFALYQLGLRSGYFRLKTRGKRVKTQKADFKFKSSVHLLDLPDPDLLLGVIGPEGLAQLKTEADEIVEGQIHLFGGQLTPLNLKPPGNLTHWTDYARGKSAFYQAQDADFPITDIKFIWEPARFGWAFTLGRAYHLTGNERYPEAFWRYFETFQEANPVNFGPNWESAQEVALRMLALAFAAQVFADSQHTTSSRTSLLAQSIADHAARIPPTMLYARAQNNNHLLSEAVGLITASLALPDHPKAKFWSKLGWKWFHRGVKTQVSDEGAYMQQSTNYHRLLLQLALWVRQVATQQIDKRANNNLQLATRWLLNLCDPESGGVPNLGPNDGAYILPLTVLPFSDYRPVLQAAAEAFLGEPAFETGLWDEMSLWLGGAVQKVQAANQKSHSAPIKIQASQSWAYLRVAQFHDRPGHADQLHLDLWWRGLNIAQDAGTYLYNADPPWNNALTHTAVHNTVMVDEHQQMTPASRFLYLDRAQGAVTRHENSEDSTWEQVEATHDGYKSLGIKHLRSVTAELEPDHWHIEDRVQSFSADALEAAHQVRLQWLLPDWKWEFHQESHSRARIKILSPYGWVQLQVRENIEYSTSQIQYSIFRAGEQIFGSGESSPTWGWVSPTYGVKYPALSFVVKVTGSLPITLISDWSFPSA